jgi:SRSO17 transposase
LTTRDSATSAAQLQTFQGFFLDLFQRREQGEWFRFYMYGQLSNLERKTIEPMVLALLGPDSHVVRTAQHFIGHGEWDWGPVILRAQTLVADWLGEADGVVIVDGSGFPKQGEHSVGVGWQYCGHLGKVANCQEGVFVVYASRQGYAFLDARLYVPEDWFTPTYRTRREACRLPEKLKFQTEPALGLEMVTRLVQQTVVPFQWVTADEKYGENPAFLDGIAALGKWYLVEVATNTRVWLRTPPVEPPGRSLLGAPRLHARVKRMAAPAVTMENLAVQLPVSAWQRHVIKEGSRGPLVAEFAFLRVTTLRDKLPGPRAWAVFRRTLGRQPEVKFYLSNAPSTCPPAELVRLSGLRWPVETALEESKGEVGLDHYETRTWDGWHHHMTLSLLAHLYLIRLRLVLQKKSRTHDVTSASIDCTGHPGRTGRFARHIGGSTLSPTSQLRRVSFASQAHTRKAQASPIKATKAQSFVVITDLS